jgi:divalent metal cation (Fe/Co/Zn/Cd) transporter
VSPLAGEDESAAVTDRLAQSLRTTAARLGHVSDVHSVRVRRTSDGLVVNYHCRFDPTLTVATAHAHVDALERRFRADHPEILRIVGHAEPLGHTDGEQ